MIREYALSVVILPCPGMAMYMVVHMILIIASSIHLYKITYTFSVKGSAEYCAALIKAAQEKERPGDLGGIVGPEKSVTMLIVVYLQQLSVGFLVGFCVP